jgi:prepilin-type N-terminal cleavage/methylation domain-containing protein
MKTNNNKGFTLIELIMVIVILGILAAVVVPKFFDLTTQAHVKNKAAVIGNIKAGLNLYAADRLVKNGTRAYPALNQTALLDTILDEVPSGWSYVAGGGTDPDTFKYSGDNSSYTYSSTGSSYTITGL